MPNVVGHPRRRIDYEDPGIPPLRSGAIEKMKAGMTACEEVLRVTGELRDGVFHTFKSKVSVT